ncbi:MAG: class I tRNA ligase family protein [Candidatus Wallbacteria bacterium]|nr:class I tRNA ligase family protein [Candidatus Wallbacteria bacterium]
MKSQRSSQTTNRVRANRTLWLPATSFGSHTPSAAQEGAMRERWVAMDLYNSISEDRRDATEIFNLHDGPPNAAEQASATTGLNKVLKDAILKYRAMRGERAPFVPGWDCHGMPAELEVSAGLGAPEDPSQLRIRCEEIAFGRVSEQRALFQRLGVLADWNRPYLTLRPEYEAGVLDVFQDLVQAGLVYRDLRPVPWCPKCRSSLSEHELEHREGPGPSWHVLFPLSSNPSGPTGGASLVSWTTAPWSLPGAAAVAVHPSKEYIVSQVVDGSGRARTIAVAAERIDRVIRSCGLRQRTDLLSLSGAAFVGQHVRHPLYDRDLPVVASATIAAERGTGCVHVSPAHGEADYTIGRHDGLPLESSIDATGTFNELTGVLSGLPAAGSAESILELLESRGHALDARTLRHRHPACGRCGQPAVVRASPQWFVALDKPSSDGKTVRQHTLSLFDSVRWTPKSAGSELAEVLSRRGDWCISRQRRWGVPIPALFCEQCAAPLLAPQVVKRARGVFAAAGSNEWWKLGASELAPGARCSVCGGRGFRKETDVFAAGFETAASWRAVLLADHRLSYPAQLLVESVEQSRGWILNSFLTAAALGKRAPAAGVLVHGACRDSQDEGSLERLLEKHPADVVRMHFLLGYRHASVESTRLEALGGRYRLLRTTLRFLLGNLQDFSPREDVVAIPELPRHDKWALVKLHEVIHSVTLSYSAHEFDQGLAALEAFCSKLRSEYFGPARDRLYADPRRSLRRRATQTVFHSLAMGLVKLLAPAVPLLSEEAWQHIPGHTDIASVHISLWPKSDATLLGDRQMKDAVARMDRLLSARKPVLRTLEKMRTEKIIRHHLDAEAVVRVAGAAKPPDGEELAALRDLLGVSSVAYEAGDAAEGPARVPCPSLGEGATIVLALSPHEPCARCGLKLPAEEGLCERCRSARAPETWLAAPRAPEAIGPEATPGELARGMRALQIRKAALVRQEDGTVEAFFFDHNQRQVRPCSFLSPLAEFVGVSPDYYGHDALLLGLGEHTDLLFAIGVHKAVRGTPLGGTREMSYANMAALITDVLRLSWGMSLKNAIAEIPHGGGKSIIDPCGRDLQVQRELRRKVYRDFGQFTASLFGRYICAEDVGNTTTDTKEMLSTCRHVMCLPSSVAGAGNPSRFTSLIAYVAAKAGWYFVSGRRDLSGARVAFQGTGNVGYHMLDILTANEPGLGALIVADRSESSLERVRDLLEQRGLESILEVASSLDPMRAANDPYSERPDEQNKPYVLYAPATSW